MSCFCVHAGCGENSEFYYSVIRRISKVGRLSLRNGEAELLCFRDPENCLVSVVKGNNDVTAGVQNAVAHSRRVTKNLHVCATKTFSALLKFTEDFAPLCSGV